MNKNSILNVYLMNNSRPIIRLVVSILSFLLLVVPQAHAATLLLPNPLHFDGLTFQTPLSIPNPTSLKTQIFTLQFGKVNSIQKIAVIKGDEILAETITPTTTEEDQVDLRTSTKPSPTPTLSQPSPTPTDTPTPTPTAPASYNSWGLSADKLFDMSNTYRVQKGLPAFQKDEKTCSLASSRAPEINTEIAEGRMHSGLRARNLPYWNTENIISYHSEEAAFNWWINDKIHHDAIVGNYTYSCVACAGNACAQEFTNYQPK